MLTKKLFSIYNVFLKMKHWKSLPINFLIFSNMLYSSSGFRVHLMKLNTPKNKETSPKATNFKPEVFCCFHGLSR